MAWFVIEVPDHQEPPSGARSMEIKFSQHITDEEFVQESTEYLHTAADVAEVGWDWCLEVLKGIDPMADEEEQPSRYAPKPSAQLVETDSLSLALQELLKDKL